MERQWETPQLVSLTKGGPGEAILTACKVMASTTQPVSSYSGCHLAPAMLCEERVRNTRIASGTVVCNECSESLTS